MTTTGALADVEAALFPIAVEREPSALRAYGRDAFPPAVKADVDGRPALAHPVGIVRPRTVDDVVRIVQACKLSRMPLVPYGGGSGICGSALATEGGLIIDTKLLNTIEQLDPVSLVVTVGAGMLGTELEYALNAHGLTCGHSPQSIGSSTVGGWVAHRGAGVFSTRYGKIDDLVQGLRVVLPSGEVLDTLPVPTSAAGPDLDALFLGAEGTLGIITHVTLKVFHLPQSVDQTSWALSDMRSGLELGRRLLQAGFRPSVVRLYDAVETGHLFPGEPLPDGQCVVLLRAEGEPDLVALTMRRAREIAADLGATDLGRGVGEAWTVNRFSTAALVKTLQTTGAVADALEVVNVYSRLADTYAAMKAAIENAARRRGVAAEAFGHASHFYDTGANIYLIFHAGNAGDAEIDVDDLYTELLDAALLACHETGGSITHHHGVGIAKSRLMDREWGSAGIGVWRGIKTSIDPEDIMNPGDKVVHRDLY